MFPDHFNSIHLYQKKKDIVICKAVDENGSYTLKGIISEDEASRQAFYDEYESLKDLSHPMVPKYYGMKEDFSLDGEACLMLCIEYCEGKPLGSYEKLSLQEIIHIIKEMGDLLAYLLKQGIIYTDLHPSNIILNDTNQTLHLIDYSFSYFYKKNPNPSYRIRFSYDLEPSAKAQQLLIQELTQLMLHLFEMFPAESLPYPLPLIIETGLHPAEELRLEDYLLYFDNLAI